MSAAARRKPAVQTEDASNKETSINMRVDKATRDLIDMAAAAQGRSRTEFVLDCARASAQRTLMDRCLFPLQSRPFEAFVDALDEPVPPNRKLKQLLKRKPVWDEARDD